MTTTLKHLFEIDQRRFFFLANQISETSSESFSELWCTSFTFILQLKNPECTVFLEGRCVQDYQPKFDKLLNDLSHVQVGFFFCCCCCFF
jgi:hypothetical protein